VYSSDGARLIGCHTLAILTDLKSQASKIALAGGVPVILALLDTHPSYAGT
jgi:TPP-dependent indolepyruvate ferredoxin oxidoreductase alpha subunit